MQEIVIIFRKKNHLHNLIRTYTVFISEIIPSKLDFHLSNLDSGIDVGQGINVDDGKFDKKRINIGP